MSRRRLLSGVGGARPSTSFLRREKTWMPDARPGTTAEMLDLKKSNPGWPGLLHQNGA
jgi:hypothetical protein